MLLILFRKRCQASAGNLVGNKRKPANFFRQIAILGIFSQLGLGWDCSAQESIPESAQTKTSIPEWVNRGSFSDGDSFILVVRTNQPSLTPVEADLAIGPAIELGLREHLSPLLGDAAAEEIVFTNATIKTLLVPGTRIVRKYEEELSEELAERYGEQKAVFYRGYAQLRIDDSFIESATHQLAENRIRSRILLAGLFGAGLLAILAVLFGYLRINHATRGFYDRRLQTISIMIFMAIIIAVYFASLSLL